ncbi:MAG: hypothetical protein SGARI_007235, partial [Bacillariaceae sp.]
YGDLDVSKTLLNTGLFDMEKAQRSASWMLELDSEEEHTPETLEYGISSVVFINGDMPFHPERFHNFLQVDPALDRNGSLELSKSKVVRIKGQVWLANSHSFPVGFQMSGRHVEIQPSEAPFVAAKGDGLNEEEAKTKDWMVTNGLWTERWGDRRSKLIFIGVDLPAEEIRTALNKALLTKEEGEELGGPQGWKTLKDPFYDGQLAKKNDSFDAYMAKKEAVTKQVSKLQKEIDEEKKI